MPYATPQDYATYSESMPPANIDRLLKDASKLIDRLTLNRIDASNTRHAEAAKNAVCAQITYLQSVDPELLEMGNIQSMNIGNFSMNFGQGGHNFNKLSSDAYDYLFVAGLLYRGVTSR